MTLIWSTAKGRERERPVHQRLRHLHERGEWFRLTPCLFEAIDNARLYDIASPGMFGEMPIAEFLTFFDVACK